MTYRSLHQLEAVLTEALTVQLCVLFIICQLVCGLFAEECDPFKWRLLKMLLLIHTYMIR